MAERDGTIVIDTQIDTKGVDAGSEKTEAYLRKFLWQITGSGGWIKDGEEMEAKKKEIMQMVNECNNERFISFLCSMIKAFKEKWKI